MFELNCIAEEIIAVMVEKKESESNILKMREYLVDLNAYESILEKGILNEDGEARLIEKLSITHDELIVIRDVIGRIFWHLYYTNVENFGSFENHIGEISNER